MRLGPGVGSGDIALRAAIAAALDARATASGWRLHSIAADEAHRRLSALLAGLRPALASSKDELTLVYQPRIDLQSGRCLGAEALLRWNHPVLGSVAPGEFVPVAEQTGMARFITAWVIEHALMDLVAWQAAGFGHGISINVSALNLAEEDFARRLAEAMRRHGVDPHLVELEFTEVALISESDRVRSTVAAVAATGAGIAIDDFGTGYSNLFYLRNIPATVLKIDQIFIRSLAVSERDQVIVRAMIRLAHDLGYRVVAEGIEAEDARVLLSEWGCDEGQGYHISRPVPCDALLDWIAHTQNGGNSS